MQKKKGGRGVNLSEFMLYVVVEVGQIGGGGWEGRGGGEGGKRVLGMVGKVGGNVVGVMKVEKMTDDLHGKDVRRSELWGVTWSWEGGGGEYFVILV